MPEDYVRPPLVATEPRSERAATWRFRVVFTLALLALALGILLLIRMIVSGPGEGNPGFQSSRAPAAPGTPLARG